MSNLGRVEEYVYEILGQQRLVLEEDEFTIRVKERRNKEEKFKKQFENYGRRIIKVMQRILGENIKGISFNFFLNLFCK